MEGQEETQRKRSAEVHDDQSVKQESRTHGPSAEGHTGDKRHSERELNGYKADVVERLCKTSSKAHGCSTPDLDESSQLLQAPYFPKMTLPPQDSRKVRANVSPTEWATLSLGLRLTVLSERGP